MESITSLNELNYILNSRKLNLTQAKDGMKLWLQNNATNIYNALLSHPGQFITLFGVSSAQELIDALNTPSNYINILKFVKVYPQ